MSARNEDAIEPFRAPSLLVRLFGEPMFARDSAISEVRGARRALPLLVYLATRKQQCVDRRQAAEALWPDLDGDAALANLRRHLHALLSVLPRLSGGATWLKTSRFSVGVDPTAACHIDIVQFEQALEIGDDEKAVSLYADHLAPSVSGEWAILERNRLGRLANDALDRLIARDRDSNTARAIAWTQRAYAIDPWRESVVRTNIELLAGLGDLPGARRFYRDFARRLQHEFGVAPEKQTTLVYDRVAASAPMNRPGNLPTWSQPIIGREAELATIDSQLAENRLVTIVGEGGIGKTRLASCAAETLAYRFIDGVLFVDLTAITQGALVKQRLASSIGLRLRDAVDEFETFIVDVGDRLIVFDNCEHVLEEAARVVSMILRASPEARIVATSREPLKIRGESITRLGALSEAAAMELFAVQARLCDKRFAITPLTRRSAASITRRLDYNPLAVKLAAAQLTVMTIDRLDALLDSRLQLLTGDDSDAAPHQRGLKASLQWSYELLDGKQGLFRLCGAFAGSFTLDAVIGMSGSDSSTDTIRGVKALVDKCMLVSEPSSATFRMLESCKVFAREQSMGLAETGRLRRTLLFTMEALFVRDFHNFHANPRESELSKLRHFIDDVEQLLPWAIQQEPDVLHSAARLLHALTAWRSFGSSASLFSHAESMLAKLESDQKDLIARTWYVIAMRLSFLDLGADQDYCLIAEAAAVECARLSSNTDLLADALLNRAAFNCIKGRFAEASDDFDELSTLGPLAGSRELLRKRNTAILCYSRRQYDEAATLLSDAAQAHARLGNSNRLCSIKELLAEIQHALGNTHLAIELAVDALDGNDEARAPFVLIATNLVGYYVAVGDLLSATVAASKILQAQRGLRNFNRGEAALLTHVAAAATLSGDFEEAFRLDAYVQEQLKAQSSSFGHTEQISRNALLSAAGYGLTSDQVKSCRAEGTSWSRSTAIDAAARAVARIMRHGRQSQATASR